MHRHRLLCLVVLCCSVAGGDSAAYLIDTFDTAQMVVSPPDSMVSDQTSGAGIAGVERDIIASAADGFGATEISIGQFGSGVFSYSQGWEDGSGFVTWDGQDDSIVLDPIGLAGIDLTDGGLSDAFALEITFVDSDVDLVLTVHSDGTDRSEATATILAGASPATIMFSFADFITTGGSGARFDDVGAIELSMRGPMGTDLQFESLATVPLSPIPEPDTFLLTSMGLLALGAARRGFPEVARLAHRRRRRRRGNGPPG